MRLTIPVLLSLIAGPAVALTPEQQAVADCIRKQPIEDLINRRSSCAPPPPVRPNFPAGLAEQDARTIARFKAMMPMCRSLKPGPAAKNLWPRLWSGFQHVPPNEPAVRAWIAEETARFRAEYAGIPRTPAMWCDAVKREFGANRMAVNLDGSKAERDCRKTDTCGDPSYIYEY